MQQNIGSLIHHTVLYINMDNNCEDTSESFKNFFKHALHVSTLQDAHSLYSRLYKKVELIIIEASSINKDEINILNSIRNLNKKVPIIFITNQIDNKTLVIAREYFIGSFLLRPFKVQELCKLSVIKISKYEKRLKTKKSLKILSKQIQLLKEEKKELINNTHDLKDLLNFYTQFQENYLQVVKINKQGMIKFVSNELKKELKTELLNKNLIQLFDNPSKIQNAIIQCMKDRKIQTVKELVLKECSSFKEWTLNILPSSEEEKEIYSFTIFFYMTK